LNKKFLKLNNNKINNNKNIYKIKERKINFYDDDNNNNNNKIIILLKDYCIKCKKLIDLKPLFLNFTNININNNIIYKCRNCKKENKEIFFIVKINNNNNFIEKKFKIYSPVYLFNYIQKFDKINVNNFFDLYDEIFYNILIYFKLYNFEYFFMFPYIKSFPDFILKIENENNFNYNLKKNKKNSLLSELINEIKKN
jgi:hypothetical protein